MSQFNSDSFGSIQDVFRKTQMLKTLLEALNVLGEALYQACDKSLMTTGRGLSLFDTVLSSNFVDHVILAGGTVENLVRESVLPTRRKFVSGNALDAGAANKTLYSNECLTGLTDLIHQDSTFTPTHLKDLGQIEHGWTRDRWLDEHREQISRDLGKTPLSQYQYHECQVPAVEKSGDYYPGPTHGSAAGLRPDTSNSSVYNSPPLYTLYDQAYDFKSLTEHDRNPGDIFKSTDSPLAAFGTNSHYPSIPTISELHLRYDDSAKVHHPRPVPSPYSYELLSHSSTPTPAQTAAPTPSPFFLDFIAETKPYFPPSEQLSRCCASYDTAACAFQESPLVLCARDPNNGLF